MAAVDRVGFCRLAGSGTGARHISSPEGRKVGSVQLFGCLELPLGIGAYGACSKCFIVLGSAAQATLAAEYSIIAVMFGRSPGWRMPITDISRFIRISTEDGVEGSLLVGSLRGDVA